EMIRSISTGKNFYVLLVYFFLISFLLSFFRLFIQHFGGTVFLNLLFGRYYSPFEEERIFMFLDMRDSTTIAEQLGNIRFSEIIQDCFRDLNTIIDLHDAQIYQYVGDEAILTWPVKRGLKNDNCLMACFSYQDILRKRKDYYQQKYGLVPEFKAGVHLGNVRVAEIGVTRRAVAFHGDVMNTTARIAGECNRLGYDLLISEALKDELSERLNFKVQLFPQVPLKGKLEAINIVGISR
ncbi:MAG: adenylate/guanylate cyclase domain-containing protein, partial [Bacteroidota bacterium]